MVYQSFFKRAIDIFGSLLTLVVLSPLLILIAIIIWLQDFGPFLFKQNRVGKNGVIFRFLKFRSMPVNTPNVESHEKDKIKITPFGKLLRRTNLDEIPQLINILKGDMSLVGPRPGIESQTDLTEFRKKNGALSCLPGLTGLAQVNSYDNMPPIEKAAWDGKYAENITFINDVKIVLKSLSYLTKKPPAY